MINPVQTAQVTAAFIKKTAQGAGNLAKTTVESAGKLAQDTFELVKSNKKGAIGIGVGLAVVAILAETVKSAIVHRKQEKQIKDVFKVLNKYMGMQN